MTKRELIMARREVVKTLVGGAWLISFGYFCIWALCTYAK